MHMIYTLPYRTHTLLHNKDNKNQRKEWKRVTLLARDIACQSVQNTHWGVLGLGVVEADVPLTQGSSGEHLQTLTAGKTLVSFRAFLCSHQGLAWGKHGIPPSWTEGLLGGWTRGRGGLNLWHSACTDLPLLFYLLLALYRGGGVWGHCKENEKCCRSPSKEAIQGLPKLLKAEVFTCPSLQPEIQK